MYNTYTQKLAEIVKNDFKIEIKKTDGSSANLRLMQNGYIDVALVQSDTLYNAENGLGIFEGTPLRKNRHYSAVTGVYTEAVQIVVRKGSGIETIADLKQKKVSVGDEESGVVQNALEILNLYGLSFDVIEPVYMSFKESSEALKNGEIDAFFCTGGTPTEAVNILSNECDIKFIELTEDDISRIMNRNPGYVRCTIPAGTYNGQDKEISTIGVRAVLVASNELNEDIVYELIKDIFDNSDELEKIASIDNKITTQSAVESVMIPFHAGAAKYLQEVGVTVEVEKNSDGGSVFGSQDE